MENYTTEQIETFIESLTELEMIQILEKIKFFIEEKSDYKHLIRQVFESNEIENLEDKILGLENEKESLILKLEKIQKLSS